MNMLGVFEVALKTQQIPFQNLKGMGKPKTNKFAAIILGQQF